MLKNSHIPLSGRVSLWLSCLVLWLVPFGNLFRFPLGLAVNILLIDLCVGALAFVAMVKMVRQKELKNVFMSGIGRLYILFVGVAFVSLLLSYLHFPLSQVLVGGLYLVRIIVYPLSAISIYGMRSESKKFLRTQLVSVAFVTIFIGFAQYFLYPDLRNLFYAGWDEHLYRMFGLFFDPNFAGCIYAMFLLMFVDDVTKTLLKGRHNLASMWMSISGIVLSALAVGLTYSRGTFVALIIALGVYWVREKKWKSIVVGMVVTVIAGVGLVVFSANKTGEGVDLTRSASVYARVEDVQFGLEIFRSAPLLGVGYNMIPFVPRSDTAELTTQIPDHSAGGVSNSYVFILATMGVAGGGVGLMLLMEMMKKFRQDSHVLSIFALVLVHGVFNNTLVYPFIMVVWLGMVGLRDSPLKRSTSDK